MYLHSLHLKQFRNYRDQGVEFHSPKTILVGDNAQGKSNLLEAIELLSTLRSHRAHRDKEFVQNPWPQGWVTAGIQRCGVNHELGIELRVSGRRSVKVNGHILPRQLDFLGQVNAVQFSCLDLELVRGGPEIRRDWLDRVLVQLEPVYAHLMEQYRRILKQRNALLKQSVHSSSILADQMSDQAEVFSWDEQLVTMGTRVIRRRDRALDRLSPLANRWHQAISGGQETLALIYQPQIPLPDPPLSPEGIQDHFWQEIERKRRAEALRATSLVGPHRDDVELRINESPARTYGSQGQQRTLVLALKLAELELIEQVRGEAPLLLLDDVLAELDLHRQNQLLDAIQDRIQTLVTATHLNSFDARWRNSAEIFQVYQGQLRSWDG